MTIEKVSYAGAPERVTEEAFDCVWVQFEDRKKPTPPSSQVIQWVDWRLQGQISRFLLQDRGGKATTFVPTRQRIGAPIVALEPPGELNWKTFAQNCAGMGMKRILILCEDPAALSEIEKEVRRQSESGLDTVVLGSDAAVGRS